MTENERLLAAIKARKAKNAAFGLGINTADAFVRTVLECCGSDLCYRYAVPKNKSFQDVLDKAAKTLTYCNEDMRLDEVEWEKRGSITPPAKLSAVSGSELLLPRNTLMVFRHVLTTPRKDRDGDVLRTKGAAVDPEMLLLWQHVHTLPIGKMLAVAEQNEKVLRLYSAIVDLNELAHDAAVMIDNGMGRFSHGFRALEYSEMKEAEGETTSPGGFDVKAFEIMEESLVSVPSNVDARVDEVLVDLVEGGKLKSPLMKAAGQQQREKMAVRVPVTVDVKLLVNGKEQGNGTGTKTAGGQAATHPEGKCGCGAGEPKETDANGDKADKAKADKMTADQAYGDHSRAVTDLAHGKTQDAVKCTKDAGGTTPSKDDERAAGRALTFSKAAKDMAAEGDHAGAAEAHGSARMAHGECAAAHAGTADGLNPDGEADEDDQDASRLHTKAARAHYGAAMAHGMAEKAHGNDRPMSVMMHRGGPGSGPRPGGGSGDHQAAAHAASREASEQSAIASQLSSAPTAAAAQRYANHAEQSSGEGKHEQAAQAHDAAATAHEQAASQHDTDAARTQGAGSVAAGHREAADAHRAAAEQHRTAAFEHRATPDKGTTVTTKAGRILAARHLETLKSVHTDMGDLAGNGYGMNKGGVALVEKSMGTVKKIIDIATPEGGAPDARDKDDDKDDDTGVDDKATKAGRSISAAHLGMIKAVHTDMRDLHGGGYGLTVKGKEITGRINDRLGLMVKDAEGDMDDGSGRTSAAPTAKEAMTTFLALAKKDEINKMRGLLDAMATANDEQEYAEQYAALAAAAP